MNTVHSRVKVRLPSLHAAVDYQPFYARTTCSGCWSLYIMQAIVETTCLCARWPLGDGALHVRPQRHILYCMCRDNIQQPIQKTPRSWHQARSKASSASRVDARQRPISSSGRDRRHSSRSDSTGSMLVPSLANISTLNVTRAELEAWATLSHTLLDDDKPNITARPRQLGSTGTLNKQRPRSSSDATDRLRCTQNATHGRTRPSTVKKPRKIDMLFDHLERLGPGTASIHRQREADGSWGALSSSRSKSRKTSGPGRAVDDSYIGLNKRRPGSTTKWPSAQDLDDCRIDIAEHRAVRKKDNKQGRSDVSIRQVAS